MRTREVDRSVGRSEIEIVPYYRGDDEVADMPG